MGSQSQPPTQQALLTSPEPQDFRGLLGHVGTRPCLPKRNSTSVAQMTYSTPKIQT